VELLGTTWQAHENLRNILGAIGNLAGTHKEHGGNNKIQKKNLTPPHPLKPQNEKKKKKTQLS
jgi:hypothetical protein